MTTSDSFKNAALDYHRYPTPGKLEVIPSKTLATQRDLALAYSPGVAYACEAIVENPQEADNLTNRSNLVAVITNGTAVLGLGAIGALASKPVMEGKAVLFKKFAGINVFDIEINENDPDKLVDIIASLEPTFGGINLEDIKAPECFEVEEKLRARMGIPVFHDDQHGTAIIVSAAILNALRVVGKNFKDVKLVTSGAGAAAIACLDLLVSLGLPIENITVTDLKGVVYKGRTELMDARKAKYAKETNARTLDDAIADADIFLGLSAPRVLKAESVMKMADKPIIMALANPTPEIMPDEVKAVRPDAIIATGRSDFPNQVNNVLCFPYIFRGALDVGATTINEAMKVACVKALADLAMAEPSEVVAKAYGSNEHLIFGDTYLIPKPFDPRLIVELAPAVAKAAMESGVATRPIADFDAYRMKLEQFVFKSGLVMRPVFDQARNNPKTIVFAEGEEERVLRAAQIIRDEGLAKPILIGNPQIIAQRLEELGLRLKAGEDYEAISITKNPHFAEHAKLYHSLMARKGISPDDAAAMVRTRPTVLASLMVKSGQADTLLCGTVGRYHRHLQHISDIIGLSSSAHKFAAMNALLLNKGTYFMCDTYVNPEPSAENIAETTLLAAEQVRRFGIEPKVALLSHSNFGSFETFSAKKMQLALSYIRERAPHLEVEGEMQADAALNENTRNRLFPESLLQGEANLLVMPTLDASNIAFNMVRILAEGLSIGPILLGAALPAHILTPSVTARGIVNMSALAVVDAQVRGAELLGAQVG
jgi:malate dehydrogenase (oxaloacetate-decarboxylating)(NADP+)